MIKLTLAQILEATGGRHIHGDERAFDGVSIDSRTISPGELFVAIKGLNFDGHDFLKDALNKGAGAIVGIPPASPPRGKTIVHVEGTLQALQALARFVRLSRGAGFPLFAITGTNGKTTTKEMAALVLETSFKVLKNKGNLNNHIGLPLSLLHLTPEHGAAVLEMGASRPGDIDELCRVAMPAMGVLTNIGYAHLEGFGSVEALVTTKLEMLGHVETIAINADDPALLAGIRGYEGKVLKYAMNNLECSPDVYAEGVSLGRSEALFTLHAGDGAVEVALKVGGGFNVQNALAAATVGLHAGLGLKEIKAGLEAFTGVPLRMQLKMLPDSMLLSDAYNANPSSMQEALKELVRVRRGRAVAVLGDMKELGPYGEAAHRRLGAWMSGLPVDLFIAVGPLMSVAASEFSGKKFRVATAEEAHVVLKAEHKAGDTVLVKGSRDMQMEKAVPGAI